MIAGLPACLALFLRVMPLPPGLDPGWSRIVRFHDGQVMRVYISPDEKWRVFVPLERMDPLLVKTTLAYEDRHFYSHPGVNPPALLRAALQNVKAGRIRSGGSTLTMQLARIAEPKRRNIPGKCWEMLRAMQFEMRLGKDRILELYLNLAPYGGNVEGVGAATLGYYGILPDKLTPLEIAFLVSLPQAPTLRRPGWKPSARPGRETVLSVMLRQGLIDQDEYEHGQAASVPTGFRPFPFEAPHAADFLTIADSTRQDITSTLDRTVQQQVENIVMSYKRKINRAGATNASVVVIENSTRKVRALVGSLDYFDSETDGQVRGFYAFRSPGSTLKPFLYILALESGVVNGEMLIEDAPYKFGDFEPVDFSGTWQGLVRAEDALAYSLNLPFILMLRRLGYTRFTGRLLEDGFGGTLEYGSYGLPIITGGMDVRLLDLTNLYVTLARGGLHGSYTLLESSAIGPENKLFRPGAVYLAMKALCKRNRPDAPNLTGFALPRGKICWKTGTSFGRRDAWSLGFQKDFTVGVWVGNFSGEGSDSIVGATVSAPIMFDIIRCLEDEWQGRFGWHDLALAEIESMKVCKYSGYRPGQYCALEKNVAVLENAHSYIECPFHKKYIVEKKTGYRASPWKKYRPGELADRIMVIYPPQVQKVLGMKGREPQYPPENRLVEERSTLQVTSPVDGGAYFIPWGVKNADRIPLKAFTSCKDGKVHWFVNDRYRGFTESGETMEVEPAGALMKIVAEDGAGAIKVIRVSVEHEPLSGLP